MEQARAMTVSHSTMMARNPARVLADNHALLSTLEPRGVFEAFELLLATPRDSGYEEAAMLVIQEWAARQGFDYQRDARGNRAIYIPGRGKGQDSDPVILQGHADMVCVKARSVVHDFRKDPIAVRIEEGGVSGVGNKILTANGTSLGADNGIGLAMAMAAGVDESIVDRPPVIFVITVEEETGLRGAIELDPSLMRGAKKLINLDSEEQGEITVGCAGATDYSITVKLQREKLTGKVPLLVALTDCPGGHSAGVIHEPRLNAIKAVASIISDAAGQFPSLQLSEIQGGEKTNSIPASASAIVWVSPELKEEAKAFIASRNPLDGMDDRAAVLHADAGFSVTEPSPKALLLPWSRGDTDKVLDTLQAIPHGVLEFSAVFDGAVETSSNLALIGTIERGYTVRCFTRSSIPGASRRIAKETAGLFPAKAHFEEHGTYEPWEPKDGTTLLRIAKETAVAMGTENPKARPVHGGLEVAFILLKLPEGAEGISIGPEIRNPHGPKESVNVASIEYTYEYLKRLLERLV